MPPERKMTLDAGSPTTTSCTNKKNDDTIDSSKASPSADRRRLVSWEQVPAWLQFNRYIRTGYRQQLDALPAFWTLFSVHNESINVWSHLLPVFGFLYLLFHPMSDALMFRVCILSFLAIFSASTTYHLFMPCCRSTGGYTRLISCDVVGALVSITTSGYSFILYGDKCASDLKVAAIAGLFGLSAAVLLFAILASKLSVAGRVRLFGVHCLLRLALCQILLLPKYQRNGMSNALMYHSVSFFVLFAGGVVNATRVPERWIRARWLDFIGNSHNIWHAACIYSCWLSMLGCYWDQVEYNGTICV